MKIDRFQFDTIDSTNNWGKENAKKLPKDHLTVVTASEQTAGRGRFNRQWISPPNQNLYLSFCFFTPSNRTDIVNISQVVAVSLAIALQNIGFAVGLKWPNDFMIGRKKVGGILCEVVPVKSDNCIVVGIGINVNMTKQDLKQIDRPATSLKAECNRDLNLQKITDYVIQEVSKDIELFLNQGFRPFLQSYRGELLHKKGEPIEFQVGKKKLSGQFQAIGDDGALILLTAEGDSKSFLAGEIE